MPLRIFVDSCEFAEISGWIDDDGPIASIEVELNGHLVCQEAPHHYRSDVEAAGFGDGRRGFMLSLVPWTRFARNGDNRVAIKHDGTTLFEGSVHHPGKLFEHLLVGLQHAEARITSLTNSLRHEQYRLEAALFHAEGLEHTREEFLAARSTSEYQAAFEHGQPLVSVCITTMNRGDLLVERALSSLRDQTYRNLQIIVAGDHCTDDTERRIAQLGDGRICFINLDKRGPYPPPAPIGDHRRSDRWRVAGTYPMNMAMAHAEGQFVTHLDEDDTYEPQRIEILIQQIMAVRADLVFHRFWDEQSDGSWAVRGNGYFELNQVGTSCVLYHRYLTRIPGDVFAYRLGEPGDWNRFRKFKMMRVRTHFAPELLLRHYRTPARLEFVAQDGEEYLD